MKRSQSHRNLMTHTGWPIDDESAPRMNPEAKREVLVAAAELIGREELARRMAIPNGTLGSWIRGDSAIPDGQFLVLSAVLVKAASESKPSADGPAGPHAA